MARRAIELDAIDVAVDMETPDKMAKLGDDHVVGRSPLLPAENYRTQGFSTTTPSNDLCT